jgi:putative iron-dependent peroxidase
MRAYPQPGIFAMGSRTHYYLELDLRPGADVTSLLEAMNSEEGARSTTGGCNVVVAFSREAWVAAGHEAPPGLTAFEPVVGPDGFTMPAAQHDAWVWVSGPAYDVVFDTARLLAAAFDPVATLAAQQAGFTYGASRDLSGFEDGTENPPLDEAPLLATVPEGQPGAGGSVVLFQRWVHDLAQLHGLPVEEQELIFGRTKDTSEELDDDVKPPSAHIERVVIEEDGEELEIFRRSVPYGDLEEHGLLFVAFSADQDRLEQMLDRMVGKGDGVVDAITRWSTPMTGAYYFAPPIDELQVADDEGA